ncbi:MAG TPA: DUF1735 domain-containing protein [Mucilaginibacter sp.]|jgi:hypothetical protein|nr:DUF1735 domain-containing protein [Mucilaginibacter sp.]
MKKRLYILTTILAAMAALSLSSCLKDPRYVTFSQGGTVINFPKGGLGNFGGDAVTDAGDTIVKQFAIDVASPTVPSSPTTVTIAVDNTIVTAYNATETAVVYSTMPTSAYVLSSTKIVVPAGQRTALVSVTFYKDQMDPSLSYMLPIKIVSGNSGDIVSGNFGVHYYHFIGNDFAGAYTWTYARWQNTVGPASGPPNGGGSFVDQPGTISPITPTEFQMLTGYNGTGVNYDVTFTKTGSGATATYSNWSVQFLPADIALWAGASITNFVPPVFTVPPPATATDPKVFEMHYISGGSLANGRYIDDTYSK